MLNAERKKKKKRNLAFLAVQDLQRLQPCFMRGGPETPFDRTFDYTQF